MKDTKILSEAEEREIKRFIIMNILPSGYFDKNITQYEYQMGRLLSIIETLLAKKLSERDEKIDINKEVSFLAENNWKVKALIRDIGSFELMDENIQEMLLKKLGLEKKIIYRKLTN